MFEYKLVTASKPQEMEQYINQWAATEGWRIQALYPPTAPTGIASKWRATLERELLVLTWKPSADPDTAGYRVYVRVEATSTLLATLTGPVTSYTVPLGLYASGQEHTFSVTSYDVAGNESPRTIVAFVRR